MRILVTGGAGYIGSIVVEQLIEAGHQVVVFDNFSQGHRAAVHPEADVFEGDLAERSAIDAALGTYQPEAVMHFASNIQVGESMQKPFKYLGDNVTNGLDIAAISSSANFGKDAAVAAEPRTDVNGDLVVNGLDVAAASSSACFGQ